jgi:hypothetical protein
MKKTMLLAAMLALTVLMMAAAPAMANNNHNDNGRNDNDRNDNDHRHFFNDLDDLDDDDLFFTGFAPLVGVEDVDFENVGDDNRKEGECRVEDRDHDGIITEVDLECFV